MEYLIIGLITGIVSGAVGFSISMWQHWLIAALGLFLFLLGKHYQSKKEKEKMQEKCRECPRPIDLTKFTN